MFCEYCEFANHINQDRFSKETKSIHDKCLVMMKINDYEGRCTCFCNSRVLRMEI